MFDTSTSPGGPVRSGSEPPPGADPFWAEPPVGEPPWWSQLSRPEPWGWGAGDLSAGVGPLPDGFEVMAPGRSLGAVLASVDRAGLADADLVVLAQARVRQIAHLQAQLMSDLVAIAGRCQPRMSYPDPSCSRGAEPVDHAVDEIAAAMTWTSAAAGKQVEFAERLTQQLPVLHQGMLAGRLDWPKAKVCADAVRGLSPQAAAAVLDRVLPDAARKTTGQLRARLAKLVIKADPAAAKRRYRNSLENRQLWHGREDDGTASLSGRFLPAERAAAAHGRIQAIADWLKDDGDERGIDQLRADILLDLLQGLPVPGPDGQDHHPLPGDPDHPDHPDRVDDDSDDAPAGDGAGADSGAGEGVCANAGGSGRGRARRGRRGRCPTCGLSKLSRGLELTAPVTTLLGPAEDPAELGSWGPVLAEAARALLADLRNAPWRISATDHQGRVIWHGPIRRRPSDAELRRRPSPADAAYLRARDRRCRFPGCRRPAGCAEIDHTTPYAQGGPTDVCNLECLCVRHHMLKSAGLWTAEQVHEGIIVWRSPLGRVYVVYPDRVDEPDDPNNPWPTPPDDTWPLRLGQPAEHVRVDPHDSPNGRTFERRHDGLQP